jgi:hypothetical protein
VTDRLQLIVQLVDERDPRRNVQLHDVLLADVVQILHERTQAVAVRGDEHALAARDRRRDRVVPVGQEARDRVLERLRAGNLLRPQARVARIAPGVALVVRRHRRWRNVVAAAPDFDLILAVLRGRFRLVQPLERAVVTLVQAPVFRHRNPQLPHLVERDPERLDGADQDRRKGEVEREPRLFHQTARFSRFGAPFLGEIDVLPSGEPVLAVPLAFAVP